MVGCGGREYGKLCVVGAEPVEEGKAVALDLQRRAEPEAAGVVWQTAGQVYHNGLGSARRCADHYADLFPGACRCFVFEDRKRRWKIRMVRACDVGRGAAPLQPTGQG